MSPKTNLFDKIALASAKFIVFLHKAFAPLRNSLLLVAFGYVSQCKHTPTCSEYFLQQTKTHGFKGFCLGLKRFIACR